jgi:hypothetical protein
LITDSKFGPLDILSKRHTTFLNIFCKLSFISKQRYMFLTISMLLNLVIYLTILFVECMYPSYSTEVYTIVCRYFWKNSTKCLCVVFFVYKSKYVCPSDRVSFKHRHRIVDLINKMRHVCQKCKHSVCIRSLFNIANWENLRCLHIITQFQDKQKLLQIPWVTLTSVKLLVNWKMNILQDNWANFIAKK